MREQDLNGIWHVANTAHPGLPESKAMFSERYNLFPKGCLTLTADNAITGYAISHPIRRFAPPALDTLLGALATDADDYYIHDIAILPECRGGGHALTAINKLLEIGAQYETASLVSVYGTAPFWSRFGFCATTQDMTEKLKPYGTGAIYMLRDNQTIR
jgi:ribosomal protein S18 acetylase RimI-like enzyme